MRLRSRYAPKAPFMLPKPFLKHRAYCSRTKKALTAPSKTFLTFPKKNGLKFLKRWVPKTLSISSSPDLFNNHSQAQQLQGVGLVFLWRPQAGGLAENN